MIDTTELFEMGLVIIPIAFMTTAAAILTRYVLVDGRTELLVTAVTCVALAVTISAYLGFRRVSREYGNVLQTYR